MISKQQAQDTSKVFQSIHTSASIALSRGATERRRIFDELSKGVDPKSYRYDWLKKSTEDLVAYMAQMAGNFNKEYTFDRCSVADLMDVLEATINKIKK